MASSVNALTPSSSTTYYHSDQIGSTRMVTDGGGNVTSTNEFYPYGQGPQPTAANHYLFSGKERDAESGGLDYFGARYYLSGIGRFLSADWSAQAEPVPYAKLDDPQTLNLYAYVRNNPISLVDPEGHVENPLFADIDKLNSLGDIEWRLYLAGNYERNTTIGQALTASQLKIVATGLQMYAAQQQSLTYNTIEGGPEQHDWVIQWQLSMPAKEHGWIVQQTSSYDPSGKLLKTEWEAWPVATGSRFTNYWPLTNDDTWRDKVGYKIEAVARFYEGLTLPATFKPNNPNTNQWNELPSTNVDPNLPTARATAPVTRTWTAPPWKKPSWWPW